jgi:hypothetical protein
VPASPVELDLRPMGVHLRMRSDAVEMLEAIGDGLARYPDDLGVTGSIDAVVRVHADGAADPDWPRVQAEDGPEHLVVRCGSAVATLQYATGDVRIDVPHSLLAERDALRLLIESLFTACEVRAGELYAVHSALVVHEGVGLLLRGPSGAGKSTLTYSCLRRGMGVCSDDWVYAAAHHAPGRFAGYPWRMMMTEDAAARFPELHGVRTVPHPAAEGRKVPVFPPVRQQVVSAEATAVVLLDPSPVLSLDAVSVQEARDRFWAPALPTERQYLSPAWVDGLLDRPVFVLRRGTDPDAATQALADLADSLR